MPKQQKKILLVEDDALIVQIYKGQLEKEGCEVQSVSSGDRALRRFEKEDFDLVLLDLVLPEKSGFEVLRDMKKKDLLEKTKVVVLSNLGEKEKVEKAMNLGAVSYLIKAHFTPPEVVDKIKEILAD